MGTCAETGIQKGKPETDFITVTGRRSGRGEESLQGYLNSDHPLFVGCKVENFTLKNPLQVKKMKPLIMYTVHLISVLKRVTLAETGRYF